MDNNSAPNRFLWNITQILAKLFEVACWIVLVAMIVMLVYSFTSSSQILDSKEAIDQLYSGMNIFGCQIGSTLADAGNALNVIRLDALMGLVSAGLMAMTYRDAFLILKTCQGQTSFSEGSTPFQKPVVRMVREIGIFLIAIPVTQLVFCTIAPLVIKDVQCDVTWTSAVLGLLMICLSQCFDKGVELEKESEGLI